MILKEIVFSMSAEIDITMFTERDIDLRNEIVVSNVLDQFRNLAEARAMKDDTSSCMQKIYFINMKKEA
jgi:hypothetical protein